MSPTNNTARVAGALYLLLLTAPFSLIYIPRTLIVGDNATATANSILAHEMLFRLGIVNELYIAIVSILLVLALYRLLSSVNKMHAVLMVILGALVSVPVFFVNVLNEIAALILVRGEGFLSAFAKPQRESLAMLFLRLHGQGFVINEIFWGLWLFPFGLLVMRSGFLPRILGLLLIVNCFAYVADSLTVLLLPSYSNVVSRAISPALTGELWIMLWLLIKGAKVPSLASAPA
jgi:hypothetical protein